MLYAAVRSGADAVYLGVSDFNARRNAENFTKDTLKSAVEYCHIRGVKVYLTLNILIGDNEFKDAADLCFCAYNAGVDAVIIADTGLAYYISKTLPELTLHASTQMTVFSPEALYPLKDIGFKRVVLARELSFEQIKAITLKAKELQIETEVFVHGALCMCVSGQCLLSAFLGGRSGNRGLCAGPCRLPFSAIKNKERYDLSLKDLSLLEHLEQLKEAGVASFKIEGRMKRPEYVAAAVAAAKSCLQNRTPDKELYNMLKDVFSRSGFTDGYFTGNLGKNMFGIRTKDDVLASDAVFGKLHELYRKENSHIPVWFKLTLQKENPTELIITDGTHTATVYGQTPEAATNKPLDKQTAIISLSKLGNTPYLFKELEFISENGLTVRASQLNALRRDAAEALSKKRINNVTPKQLLCLPNLPLKNEYKNEFVLRLENIELLPQDANDISAVIIPAENIKSPLQSDITVIAELPRISADDKYIESLIASVHKNGIKYVSCGNLSQVSLVEKAGLFSVFGFGMNVFSSYTVEFAKALGAKAVLLSPELTLNQIKNVSSFIPTAAFVYGKLPLMIFKNCPVSNAYSCGECKKKGSLTDRKNLDFPVKCRSGFCELLNGTPIWMADRLSEVFCDYKVLYFSDESKQEISRIFTAFQKGEKPYAKFTRGLYYKGVL